MPVPLIRGTKRMLSTVVTPRLSLEHLATIGPIAKARVGREIWCMAKSSGGSDSKYAGRSAATGRYVMKPATKGGSYRSAISGRFVTAKSGKASPSTHVRESGSKKPKGEK